MRIAAFGDLHLTHRPALDKHGADEVALLRFDDHLTRSHDRILLLGDIFQTDYGPYPGSRAEVFGAITERYPRIFRRWRAAPCTMLYGNHDRITQGLMGAVQQVRMVVDGLRMWFIHGHQFDPFIERRGQVPYVVTWMIGGLRRMGWHRLADYLEGPLYQAGQRRFPILHGEARQEMIDGAVDLVAMGHSHTIAWRALGKGLYLNAGDCTTQRMQYLSLDTQTLTAQVRVFTPPNRHAVLLQGILAA
ncbi:metallophosphoesterase family protein [Desulfatitalea alkaliphila]|uniref:Metallophosphoesterase family protein n=1 Tax=Desulfatitalea alkaliphila TaxID=2929485 RepID=A0AA41US26_9BACT|nr:metallophosphoesterase [Desulfatitalea alkaliphila]MCJ8502873.1 metallophosphoesterase family protein [Desulfatitalea alkaliphila]